MLPIRAPASAREPAGSGTRDDGPVRHARFDIASLAADRVDLPLRVAYLLVAESDDSDTPQWELLAYGLSEDALDQRIFRIDLVTLDDRYLRGEAALVRSVDGMHVFRGVTALDGFDADADFDRGREADPTD